LIQKYSTSCKRVIIIVSRTSFAQNFERSVPFKTFIQKRTFQYARFLLSYVPTLGTKWPSIVKFINGMPRRPQRFANLLFQIILYRDDYHLLGDDTVWLL
jgi:hypothetical protein